MLAYLVREHKKTRQTRKLRKRRAKRKKKAYRSSEEYDATRSERLHEEHTYIHPEEEQITAAPAKQHEDEEDAGIIRGRKTKDLSTITVLLQSAWHLATLSFFFLFSIPFIIFAFLFSLPPSRNSDLE